MPIKIDYTLHKQPRPTQYEVYRDGGSGRIVIDRVRQEDGSYQWAVRDDTRRCLSVDGQWDFESMPSSRPDDWIKTHRFKDFRAAQRRAVSAARIMLGDYEDQVRIRNEHEEQRREQV